MKCKSSFQVQYQKIEDFSGATVTVDNKVVGWGVTFSGGLAKPEINKQTGDIIYIDNRALVTRDASKKKTLKSFWNSKTNGAKIKFKCKSILR